LHIEVVMLLLGSTWLVYKKAISSSSKMDLCTQRSHVTASSRCKSELLYHILSGSPTKPRKAWYCAICMLNLSGNS
jgi:hypothetical protein